MDEKINGFFITEIKFSKFNNLVWLLKGREKEENKEIYSFTHFIAS